MSRLNWILGPRRAPIWRATFVFLALAATWATLTPNADPVGRGLSMLRWIAELVLGDPNEDDKIGHFAAYGALGGALALSRVDFFRGRAPGGRLFGAVLLAAYGASLEYAQLLGGVRYADPADGLANALGAICGVLVGLLLERIAEIRASRRAGAYYAAGRR